MLREIFEENQEFQDLPQSEKQAIVLEYFDDQVAGDDFRALPGEEQKKIKDEFLVEDGFTPELTLSRLGHQIAAKVGRGLKSMIHAEKMLNYSIL